MLSHKNNKNQFIYEEELDQAHNRNTTGIRNMNNTSGGTNLKKQNQTKRKDSLVDSLDGIKSLNGFKERNRDRDKEIHMESNNENNYENKDINDNNNISILGNNYTIGNNTTPSQNIVIKINKEEFLLEGDSYLVIRNYLKELTSCYDPKNNLYIFPKWIEKNDFELFLNFLILSSPNHTHQIDLSHCKKIILISVFLKSTNVILNLINDCIIPNLDKSTCLRIIKDYIDFIYQDDTRNPFVGLIQKCIEIAAMNIFFLINNMGEELFTISKDSLEEVIERYFESAIYSVNIDHSLIMRLMMKNRKLGDVYELLENERKRSLNTFEKLYEEGLEPTIIWKIDTMNPCEGFYKESEEFLFENVSLILINYYDSEKDLFSMALKITEIKDKNNNQINTDDRDSFQFIVSILSICEISEINFKSKINFNCIFSNTKTKILVSKIENFSLLFKNAGLDFNDEGGVKYSLLIYFSISYNFSSILSHICKNFYEYYSLNSISRISRNVLSIILKNESLNARNEDEVLFAVMNWSKKFII